MKRLISLAAVAAAQCTWGAVSEYVRTEIPNYNGHEGCTLVTYVKPPTAEKTGRAWIMKFDMTKGYRLRAYYGDGNGGRARIGTMGENLVAEGEQPICGMNADYFYTASNMAYSTGMTIVNSRMVYPGFNNANPTTHYFFMETGDRRYAHGKPVRTDGKTSGFVAHGYDLVTADGRKIRNAVRTNWCNYPVKEGQINPVNTAYDTVGKVEGTIGNYQSRTQYPRVMIGYGTNEVDGAQHEIVAMFVNDGRQADWSYGVTDVDAAQMMIDEGCWEVGEFDGGGSAAFWAASGPDSVYPRDTTANGGYLNLPSDGYPRKDANGIFMLAPTDAPATVTIGANWYYDLDEALWAVAPGETISVTNATTLAGTNEFFTSCTIASTAEVPSATPIACPAGTSLVVAAGVRVCFSNAVFTGASATLRAAGTAAVAGHVSFDRVDVAAGGAFELAGPLERALVVNNPAAVAEGDVFGTATGNFGAGVRLLRHPSDATLVARAVSNGSAANLRWVRATDTSGGLSSANYVQDGLVAQFDALENTGVGQRDASATVWKDLVGNGKVTLAGAAAWGDRYLDATTTRQSMTDLASVYNWSVTAEFAVNVITNAAAASAEAGKSYWPTFFGEGQYRVHSTGVKKGSAPSSGYRLFINGRDPRPTMSSFWIGTMGTTSDGQNYRMYRDGANAVGVVDSGALNMNKLGTTWTLNENGTSGFFHNHCYAFRLYDRVLTAGELEQNAALDGLRFFSFTYTGTGAAVDWSAVPWTAPERATTTAPNAATHYAQVKNATVAVQAAVAVSLKGLSLESGATLDIAFDAVVDVKVLYVGGARVPRGIYTGTGTFGTQVDWLAGGGVLRVAGSFAASVPTKLAIPAPDGWYEFGLTAAEGGGYGYTKGYPASPSTKLHWIKADRPQWQDYAFEPGAKLRLVGYVFLEQIPAGVFDEIDLSHATYILVNTPQPYADGTAFTLPAGVEARYQPGTGWVEDLGGTNWLVTSGSSAFTSDLEVAGTWRVYGDGTQYANQQYDGAFGGTGTLKLENFSKQARFTSSFALNGKVTGFENAQLLWIDALAVTSRLSGVAFSNCGETYQTNASYSATGIFFGKDNSGATADHELYIASVSGGARSIVDAKGKRWRSGGVIAAWGSNTVHVGKLTNPLHIVARRQDQNCNRGWFNSASAVGPGFFVFDEIAAGLFLSTNVYVTAGKVTGSPVFDWTYQSGAVNQTTFDVTNTCSSMAVAKATDVAMLPARLGGFAGSVQLTDAAERTYPVAMDFTRGTNALYNVGGCIGSGTLTAAPTAGTLAVTFAASGDAVPGDYALARFTSGGGLLANWNVTLNGNSSSSADAGKGYRATVVKDSTGIWLKVRKGGLRFVIR